MAVNFPTPTQIFEQYKTSLKSSRPDINVKDRNGEALIRGKVTSGILAGVYADQRLVNNDTFISTARYPALVQKGVDVGIPPQPAVAATTLGFQVTGATPAINIPAGTVVQYPPTGVLYSTLVSVVTDVGGNATLSLRANVKAAMTNVDVGETLVFVAPPPGIPNTGVLSIALADGADPETTDSYRARLLLNQQRKPAGGNETDYPNFAFFASPSVRSAQIVRFGRGLGTVDVYITTGTTDIDNAVTNGIAILRIPSAPLIATVQAYYDANVPLTDCPVVFSVVENDIPVSVAVDLAAGITMATVPSDPINNPLNLNVLQLIQREVGRALYKVPVGGTIIPGQSGGFVIASQIEQAIDFMLSATANTLNGSTNGLIPVLIDREVAPLNGTDYNLPVAGNALSAPGVITVTEGV